MKYLTVLLSLICAASPTVAGKPSPFPEFRVPGQEEDMATLNALHLLHHEPAFTPCTLWDGWLPMATLWASETKRGQYREALLNRRMDAEGCVSMQQHRGMAHSEGWPFPAWQQSTGAGFHFSIQDDVWAIQNFGQKALTSTAGWEITGAVAGGIDPVRGLRLKATGDTVTITTPAFRCGTVVAPFARIEWAAQGLPAQSRPAVSWLLEGEAAWPPERRAPFPPLRDADGFQYANVPLYRQPGYAGMLTRYRLTIDHAAGAQIDLKSVITAVDTRHPTTGPLFVRASTDYFTWTQDLAFLRGNIIRMRRALGFTLKEFRVREEKHVHVTWVGHDGRSGIVNGPDGKVTARPGLGVGNNYWDLLPFGAHDAMATMTLYDALLPFAALERRIAGNPAWAVPEEAAFAPGDLTALAGEIRGDFQKRFWNPETGRFSGWIDCEGRAYDYGFSFLNLEAVACGLAAPEQARSILAWVDGRREVAGDTSRGADIYRWRFAPRATTRRNVESYVWPWTGPGTIPWGNQVQDGGAVLGFSYHDLMARLAVNGPEDAWKRLREILVWFREVQREGGYRPYYARPGRGTLQGGGQAGGLGLDVEFLESVLVPQVMLYGFLGFRVTGEGFTLDPQLPPDWPSLTIAGIRLHDHLVDLTVMADGRAQMRTVRPGTTVLRVVRGTRQADLAPAAADTVTALPGPP